MARYSRDLQSDRRAWRLWFYGIGMLAPVLYFVWQYPLRDHSDVLTDLGKLSAYERAPFWGYVVAMAVLFILYLLALFETRRLSPRVAMPAVFGCGSMLAYAMAWMYPVNAIDVFLYALRSRLLTTYGANPMVALFKDYPQDPWQQFGHGQWVGVASPYGPLWNLIAAPLTYLADDQMIVALVGFKLLAVVCLLAASGVIFLILRNLQPSAAATGALLFLWNPLVLWEAVGNSHNDIVMIVPLLLALLAWVRRRDGLVVPLLVVAALIKYVPVVLIPLAAVAVWRRAESWSARWRLLGSSAALSLIAVIVALFPFYDLAAVRDTLSHQGNILRMSPPALLSGYLGRYYDAGEFRPWMRLAGLSLVLSMMLWQAGEVWRRPSHLPRAFFEVIFIFLMVATWYFNVWYLIWPVALAALLPWGWPTVRVIVWAVGGIAYYALSIWIEAWWQPGFATLQNVAVALLFVGPFLLALMELGYHATLRLQNRLPQPDLQTSRRSRRLA